MSKVLILIWDSFLTNKYPVSFSKRAGCIELVRCHLVIGIDQDRPDIYESGNSCNHFRMYLNSKDRHYTKPYNLSKCYGSYLYKEKL